MHDWNGCMYKQTPVSAESPPVSSHSARGAIRAATATALPELLPAKRHKCFNTGIWVRHPVVKHCILHCSANALLVSSAAAQEYQPTSHLLWLHREDAILLLASLAIPGKHFVTSWLDVQNRHACSDCYGSVGRFAMLQRVDCCS